MLEVRVGKVLFPSVNYEEEGVNVLAGKRTFNNQDESMSVLYAFTNLFPNTSTYRY